MALSFLDNMSKPVQRKTIDIPSFGGVNSLPDRKIGQPSWGRNYYTRNGILFTRGGYSTIAAPSPAGGPYPITSLHSAGAGKVTTRLIAQYGSASTGLLYRTLQTDSPTWAQVAANLGSGKMYSGNWTSQENADGYLPGTTFLMIGNGTADGMYSYGIEADTFQMLTQEIPATEGVPWMGAFLAYANYCLGWGSGGAYPNQIWLNGPDTATLPAISKDYWPPDYVINLGSAADDPVLDCFVVGGYVLALMAHSYGMIQGSLWGNFEWSVYGSTGEMLQGASAQVNDSVFYLGYDSKVYENGGSGPSSISQPVDEYLQTENFAPTSGSAFALSINNQFHLFVPNATTTREYIYDTVEGEWYINEYAFVATCGCVHGDFLQPQYIHLGTSTGAIIRLDGSANDNGTAIETQAILGPFPGIVRARIAALRLMAKPTSTYSINAYASTDEIAEGSPAGFSFAADGTTQTVKQYLPGKIGYNNQVRLDATTAINNLKQGIITYVPREAK